MTETLSYLMASLLLGHMFCLASTYCVPFRKPNLSSCERIYLLVVSLPNGGAF